MINLTLPYANGCVKRSSVNRYPKKGTMTHWVHSRRFGYGGLSDNPAIWTPAGMLGQVQHPEQWPVPIGGIAARKQMLSAYHTQIIQAKKSADLINERFYIRRQRNALISRILRADALAKISYAAGSPTPFRERMVSFWMNHFAVNARRNFTVGALVPLLEAEAVRPFLAGYFSDLLRAVVKHPAMFMFLDQHRSVGPNSTRGLRGGVGLNENLGREILELHTLGVNGGYGQRDVRELALLLTGLRLNAKTHEAQYVRQIAEPGDRSILGRRYGGSPRTLENIDAVLNDLAVHPSTARYVCTKLAQSFLADRPSSDSILAMESAWRATGGNLPAVYEAMIQSANQEQLLGYKIRLPEDYVVAGLRACRVFPTVPRPMVINPRGDIIQAHSALFGPLPARGPTASERQGGAAVGAARLANRRMTGDDAPPMSDDGTMISIVGLNSASLRDDSRLSVAALKTMNQAVWSPPGPQGWDEEAGSWLTPQGIAARIEWSLSMGEQYGPALEGRVVPMMQERGAPHAEIASVMAGETAAKRLALALASPSFNRR